MAATVDTRPHVVMVVLNDVLAALPDSEAWHSWSREEHDRVV